MDFKVGTTDRKFLKKTRVIRTDFYKIHLQNQKIKIENKKSLIAAKLRTTSKKTLTSSPKRKTMKNTKDSTKTSTIRENHNKTNKKDEEPIH